MTIRRFSITAALVAALATLAAAQAPVPGIGPFAGYGPYPFATAFNAGTDVVCALHADVITGLVCNNAVVDGTTETTFTTTVTVPGGVLSSGGSVPLNFQLNTFTTATIPTLRISIKIGGTAVFTSSAFTPGTSTLNLSCRIVALAAASSTTPLVGGCAYSGLATSTVISNTTKSIAVNTLVSNAVTITATYGAATLGNAVWLYYISPV